MTATAHTLVAGAIASKFTDPVTASTLALLSHFIMDAVPHWDIGTSWRKRSKFETGALAIGETSLGIIVGFFLFRNSAPLATLLLAIFFSLLPDWLETPWYIFFASPKHLQPSIKASLWERISYRIYKSENYFHTKAKFPLGVLTQIITVIFFLRLLA
ncbi:hypothetical protein A2875_03715 [Candidatus Gottesmanbacteria bacterium RIFCSPHIGHO2_01_FULL_46_14]|uniref:Uncharacterized protein n=3 Tax=Candidatus Gottesmaniibacteriota TaxID=1752720 RepID=A0A1F5ZMY4_9BACT|nr:MAG: hypothetical protein UY08_C0006G0014 [Candidatus Gottesmanbacteria bacterium GW2011_GWA1_47_8]OGG13849.1 MAG: hypothetical protein A2875_03715 [Candidatus Gottesmanbacteria bacterium RIFCSPHIGHO2_01_FULL_46_14]OGG29601.1 MAG: hypothetical protein A2971_00990 [Candidatus Gottesmanbacteria bacterium RIFCSPLOWO2_01_FULL_46_21]